MDADVDLEKSAHWSAAIWSTHVGGIHVSIICPIVLNIFAGFPLWITLLWGGTSFVTHYSGFGLMGSGKRLKVKAGRLVHGASRVRQDRVNKLKRKRGAL